MAVKIIDHETVEALRDSVADPGLEHPAPVRVIEAGPVFLHAADGVAVVLDWRAVGIFFQQLKRILYRLGSQEFFVPQVVVKLEEAARAVLSPGIADKKLDVEMADHKRVESVQILVALLEPRAVFSQADLREMGGIAPPMPGVRQAPVVGAVKADLRQFRPRLLHEGQVIFMGVIGPVRNHGGEFQGSLRCGGAGGQ